MSDAYNGDVRIDYEVIGEGESLLFVHGLGYDRLGWGPLPHVLAEDFRVILFDNRGVGESDVPPGPYSVAQMADDAVAVLDAAGVGRAHVLGVSLGGFVAQELAVSHPDRVDRLVLASTGPGGPNMYPMPAETVEAMGRFPTMEREAGLRLMVENSVGESGVRRRPELVDEIYSYRLERAPSVEAWRAQAIAGASFDLFDRISEIEAPTLVITGDVDVVIDPRNSDLLVERIPNARLHSVHDRGHMLIWEEGESLAPVVKEFLQA